MKLLELFCGTKSITNVFKENGEKTFTIDNNSLFEPDLCKDILEVTKDDIPFKPEIIWASPPCQCFSVASIGTHWAGGKRGYVPKSHGARTSLRLLEHTINLINELGPTYFFIENPRGMMRKTRFMKNLVNSGIARHTVTYCQYGDKRMKPTDIWTNCENWHPRPRCKNGDTCHERAPRGSRTGTQGLKNATERGRIPKELCEEIYLACKKQDNRKLYI